MKALLTGARNTAKTNAHLPPDISPEQLVEAWHQQNGRCAWTDRSIDLLGRGTAIEHDHDTGEFRGFVCAAANAAEGHLAKLTSIERATFIARAFPETAEILQNQIAVEQAA
jgi:Recombination endonuclease VII